MRLIQKLSILALLALVFSGCSTITNLTASRQPRNKTGLYPIEVTWNTREQAIRPDSIKPIVMVGLDQYPMQPTPLVTNRWETLVPVPTGQNSVLYRFKVDYELNGVPARRRNSKLSPEYKLEIFDRK